MSVSEKKGPGWRATRATFVVVLLTASQIGAPGDCCSIAAAAPRDPAMSCCAEPILQCPACHDPGEKPAMVLAATHVSPAPRAAGLPLTSPIDALGSCAVGSARQPVFGLHSNSPPLYRLHAQLLI